MVKIKPATSFLKSKWHIILLLIIVAISFYLREIPHRFDNLPDIDTYYIYRMSKYIVEHNFQLPEKDTLRNYPYGDTFFDRRGALYFPAIFYVLLNPLLNITYFDFAFIFPSLMGALAVFFSYFFAKDLFNSKKAGLLTSFFLGTVTAFFTRTSTGEIEKEATSAPFMFMSLWLFIKAYKEKNLKYGILSGIFLGVVGTIWGGIQIIILLYSVFAGFVFIFMFFQNKEKNLLYSYVPAVFIGLAINHATPSTPISPLADYLPAALTIMLLISIAIKRFRIVAEKDIKFVPLGVLIVFIVAFFIGSIFIPQFKHIITIISGFTPQAAATTTVAENVPGNWNNVLSSTGITYTSLPGLPSLNPIFSLWFLYFLGILVLVYKLLKTRDLIYLFPLIFLVDMIYGVFYRVRLTYMLGIPAALVGGFFVSWLIDRSVTIKTTRNEKITYLSFLLAGTLMLFASFSSLNNMIILFGFIIPAAFLILFGIIVKYSNTKTKTLYYKISNLLPSGRIDVILIPIIIFVALTLSLNLENARGHAGSLGPSINNIFIEAMNFLKNQTPEGSSVFSWWDFGYWFQTVGERPTILDGGGVGVISRYDAALFFTDSPENWDKWKPTLVSNISYILMDYTLPGKYGAITKIASNGQNIRGFVQFNSQPNVLQTENMGTIYEYTSPQLILWMPVSNNQQNTLSLSGPPMLLGVQNGQIVSRQFVRDICTSQGIITVTNRTDTIGGCVAITSLGIFYIFEEDKNTMFSRLMFMDGAGLPVEKVFDNNLIKIYKVNNNS